MPINEEGRALLIADLRANAAHYDQSEYALQDEDCITENNACGTVMCLAGICLLRKIGWEKFLSELNNSNMQEFIAKCIEAGREQLGIAPTLHNIQIFEYVRSWPPDLYERWWRSYAAERRWIQEQQAEIAVEALMRLNEDGSIKTLEEYNAATTQEVQISAV